MEQAHLGFSRDEPPIDGVAVERQENLVVRDESVPLREGQGNASLSQPAGALMLDAVADVSPTIGGREKTKCGAMACQIRFQDKVRQLTRQEGKWWPDAQFEGSAETRKLRGKYLERGLRKLDRPVQPPELDGRPIIVHVIHLVTHLHATHSRGFNIPSLLRLVCNSS